MFFSFHFFVFAGIRNSYLKTYIQHIFKALSSFVYYVIKLLIENKLYMFLMFFIYVLGIYKLFLIISIKTFSEFMLIFYSASLSWPGRFLASIRQLFIVDLVVQHGGRTAYYLRSKASQLF